MTVLYGICYTAILRFGNEINCFTQGFPIMQAVKDEVIVDLVERCRSNQKKLMQMLTSTGLVLYFQESLCLNMLECVMILLTLEVPLLC